LRCLQGAIGQPHRHTEFTRKPARAADVIVVFMSNQHRAYRRRLDAVTLKASDGLLQRKSAIGEYPGAAHLDHQAVAFAAAAQ
jgi:hypothetical protein